ncbi:hypothetical protein E1301_Tti018995 [Triplophysa tibetana]|uniref:Uncharacterized protein n=1 Tax=Triplophysa tibetana TaxID=1572043 RepID=A0A5A9PUS5_9TELE|nr:hypothetical protein E1301_Tti018995 [Triplophysa tibetana]
MDLLNKRLKWYQQSGFKMKPVNGQSTINLMNYTRPYDQHTKQLVLNFLKQKHTQTCKQQRRKMTLKASRKNGKGSLLQRLLANQEIIMDHLKLIRMTMQKTCEPADGQDPLEREMLPLKDSTSLLALEKQLREENGTVRKNSLTATATDQEIELYIKNGFTWLVTVMGADGKERNGGVPKIHAQKTAMDLIGPVKEFINTCIWMVPV